MPTTEQLSENSHQGFEGIKATLCLAELEAKPTVTSGMPACLRPNGTGSRCSGKERDAESGLDYFLARYYSAAQGRFTSPDEFKGGIVDPFTGQQVGQPGPLPYADIADPQTLNKYAYVRNNPLRYVDPDGHEIGYYYAPGGAMYSPYNREYPDSGSIWRAPIMYGAAVAGALFGPEVGAAVLLRLAPLSTAAGSTILKARDNLSQSLSEMSDAVQSGSVKLSEGTASRLGAAQNAIAEHLTNSNISGAVKQAAIGKEFGGNHLAEVTDTAASLKNLSNSLTGALQNPNLSDSTRRMFTNTINAIKPVLESIKRLKEQSQ